MGQRADEINRRLDEDAATVSDATDDTAEIRADIERTRADMSETIDEIQARLSPDHLKEQAQEQFQDIKEQVREQVREQFQEAKQVVRDATIGRVEHMARNASDTVNDARYSMMDTIKENHIPAALVGIGLSWLWMNRSSRTPARYSGRGSVRGGQYSYDRARTYDDRRGYYERPYDDRVGYYAEGRAYSSADYGQQSSGGVTQRAQSAASNVADRAQSTASNVASTVSETASNVASTVSETASTVADRAQYQAQRVEDRFQSALENNPLAVGAVALALGTAVGLALPQTERENQLMGEARDNLIDRAQEVASTTIEKVQSVAADVADDAKQTVKEQAREQGLTS